MSKFILTATVLSILAGPAYSGDLSRWSGGYVGFQAGGAWSDASWQYRPLPGADPDLGADHTGNGLIGGAQAGYNWQIDQFVIGTEISISASDVDGSARCPGRSWECSSELKWLGTGKLKLGYAVDDLLIYGVGGVAGVAADRRVSRGSESDDMTKVLGGYVFGAGAEYALSEDWSIRAEYLHYKFTSRPYQRGDIVQDIGFSLDTGTVGLNYRF